MCSPVSDSLPGLNYHVRLKGKMFYTFSPRTTMILYESTILNFSRMKYLFSRLPVVEKNNLRSRPVLALENREIFTKRKDRRAFSKYYILSGFRVRSEIRQV